MVIHLMLGHHVFRQSPNACLESCLDVGSKQQKIGIQQRELQEEDIYEYI